MEAFASQGDLAPKKITFRRLSKSAYAFTTGGDPNSGVIVGDDGVMVIDAQATKICTARRELDRWKSIA